MSSGGTEDIRVHITQNTRQREMSFLGGIFVRHTFKGRQTETTLRE